MQSLFIEFQEEYISELNHHNRWKISRLLKNCLEFENNYNGYRHIYYYNEEISTICSSFYPKLFAMDFYLYNQNGTLEGYTIIIKFCFESIGDAEIYLFLENRNFPNKILIDVPATHHSGKTIINDVLLCMKDYIKEHPNYRIPILTGDKIIEEVF
jgi:hypothetical protein